jgi:hypothetical protein
MDILIDYSNKYIRKVAIGKFAVCEVDDNESIENMEKIIQQQMVLLGETIFTS